MTQHLLAERDVLISRIDPLIGQIAAAHQIDANRGGLQYGMQQFALAGELRGETLAVPLGALALGEIGHGVRDAHDLRRSARVS